MKQQVTLLLPKRCHYCDRPLPGTEFVRVTEHQAAHVVCHERALAAQGRKR